MKQVKHNQQGWFTKSSQIFSSRTLSSDKILPSTLSFQTFSFQTTKSFQCTISSLSTESSKTTKSSQVTKSFLGTKSSKTTKSS